jgi:hypothetical protein
MFFFNLSGTALPYIVYFAALAVYIMLGSMSRHFREDETLYSEDIPPVVSEYTAPVSTLMETAYTVTFHQPAGARQLTAYVLPVYHYDTYEGNTCFPPGSQAFHKTFIGSDYFCRPPPFLS